MELPDAAAPSQANYRLLSRDREDEKTEEELARYIEDRYKQYDERGDYDGAADASVVGQQGLQPSINDPKLWMVQCRPGREREACIQLLQKYYTMHDVGKPLLIKTAVALDHLKVRGAGGGGGGADMSIASSGAWMGGRRGAAAGRCSQREEEGGTGTKRCWRGA